MRQENDLKMNEHIDYKRKRIARLELTRAIKRGDLTRSPTCDLCIKQAHTQGHHVDYGQPLIVKWLCDACHGYAHRKEHPLNPINNQQTKLNLEWEEGDSVTVSFIVPFKSFLYLKNLAVNKNLAVSELIRELIMVSFPNEDEQPELNYGEIYDHPQNDAQQRISGVETNEEVVLEQELSSLQIVWSQRGDNLPRMDQRLQQVLCGDGASPRKLQRARAIRQDEGVLQV